MKPKKKKTNYSNRALLSYSSYPIWPSMPVTIKMLKENRKTLTPNNELSGVDPRPRGINVTIILSSATCIEGFLVDCLMAIVSWCKFVPKKDLKTRLLYDLEKRISEATFEKLRELCAITLGKEIKELINDDKLIESIQILIKFRNGLAHSRSMKVETYVNDIKDIESEMETEIQKQYHDVLEYLERRGLIKNNETDIFTDEIADHFSDLIFPYMDAVTQILPTTACNLLKPDVDWARKYTLY